MLYYVKILQNKNPRTITALGFFLEHPNNLDVFQISFVSHDFSFRVFKTSNIFSAKVR